MTELKREQRQGLDEAAVAASRQAHGKNVFTTAKREGFRRRFFANLGDPVVVVLLIALGVNLLLLYKSHDWVQSVGIAISILLATTISTLSECGSEAAFERLNRLCGEARCRVRRVGQITELDTREVVVGDILLLSAGERIPADGVLCAGELTVDQSPLTGESREAEKRPIGDNALTPASPRSLLAGCTVLSGEGEMEVLAVGDRTALGGISGELQTKRRDSPLKVRLSHLARQISRIGYVAALVCALAYLFHGLFPDGELSAGALLVRLTAPRYMGELLLHALMLGLTVVVVAVPEGLPMMIAVVLSSNMHRMVKDNVLVRRPAGLEAAGSMNILFTDKTGTLTRGQLSLCRLLTAFGDFTGCETAEKHAPRFFDTLCLAAHAAGGAARGVRDGQTVALGGNSTDRALLTAFLHKPQPSFSIVARQPFDSTRKLSATALSNGRVFLMGAPERLLPFVRWAASGDGGTVGVDRAAFLSRVRRQMDAGERVVLLCEGRQMPHGASCGELTLLCALCFCDPLRPEAPAAVRTLRGAGVQVVMMTGDGKETAARIARECGILWGDRLCLDATELSQLTDAEIKENLPRLAVIARALPSDKSRMVRICAEAGLVVGMTGDGINDAPALKAADVGFAMGSGTQVAKEAGDVVILDDNLASVCRAVLYGRTVFKSIRKFITLQLVMNFCAVGISIIGPFIGFEAPVTVVQMLWINMIMDTLGGLAFAGEAPMPYYMKEPPKPRDEPILTRGIAGRIAFLTIVTLGISVFFLCSDAVRRCYRESEGQLCLLTAFFAFFIFAGVFNCFNARTDRASFFSGLTKNKAFILIMGAVATVQILFVYLGGTVLRTMPLTAGELAMALLPAFSVIPMGWLHLVWRRLGGKSGLY